MLNPSNQYLYTTNIRFLECCAIVNKCMAHSQYVENGLGLPQNKQEKMEDRQYEGED